MRQSSPRLWAAVSVVVCSLVAPVSVLAEGQASTQSARPTTYESPSTLAPSVSELQATTRATPPTEGKYLDATTRPANEAWVTAALVGATKPATTQATTTQASTQATTTQASTQASSQPVTQPAATQVATQPSTSPATTQSAPSAQEAAQAAAQAAQAAAQAAQAASQAAAQAAVQAAAQAAAQAAQAASQAAQAAAQAAQAAQAAAQALQASTSTQPAAQAVVTTTQASTAPATSPTTTQSTTQATTTQASTSPSTTQAATGPSTTQASTQPGDTRFFGGLLDHRSLYGQNWFAQPLGATSLDANNDLFVLYNHQQGAQQQDTVTAGVENRFEMLTLTLEANYVRLHQASPPPGMDATETGISSFDIAARHPLYQYVSPDGKIDSTFGARLLGSIPSGSEVGQDGRVEFDLWNLVRFGEHWMAQFSIGANEFIGPNLGGETTVPWTAMIGYRLERDQLNLPGVSETWLTAEVEGDGQLSTTSGGNPVFGIVGTWVNFKPISHYQPRLGLGFQFPLDGKANDQADWGVIANFLIYF